MSQVSIVKCRDYSQDNVDFAVEKAIADLGGIGKFVKEGSRVLLKPNLLIGKGPEKHVTTHPALVEGVAKILRRHKCRVFIGDSPSIGGAVGASKKAGYIDVAKKVDGEVIDFKDSLKISDKKNNIFKDIELASEIWSFDGVINLPKVKTHGQMGLTLGVKNMFGCVVGTRKVHWHLRAGSDKGFFAKMLVEIYDNINPCLTITDGITGMEGNGPQHGNPRDLGVIVASPDGVSNDLVISHLVNYDPEKLFTNIAAREKGVGKTRLDEITFMGEPLSAFDIVDFKKLPVSSAEFGIPPFIFGLFKNSLASRPLIDVGACKLCKVCLKVCPPKVMKLKKDRIVIDYRKCIRCFCCQEICPHGAISVGRSWISRIWK